MVAATAVLRRTVNRGCVRRYASCPNQRRANTPHRAVPLKVCWISLWCLEVLQPTTQTQSRCYESLPLFPCSLPLRSSRRPFLPAVGQTVHCLRRQQRGSSCSCWEDEDASTEMPVKNFALFFLNYLFFLLYFPRNWFSLTVWSATLHHSTLFPTGAASMLHIIICQPHMGRFYSVTWRLKVLCNVTRSIKRPWRFSVIQVMLRWRR